MTSSRLKWGLLAVLGVLGLVLVFSINPTQTDLFPKCPFHRISGLHCPGCGTTRATHQFLHGNISRGFAYNPILALILPLLGALLWEKIGRTRGWQVWPITRWVTPWILWLILAYWVARNVPIAPFTLLAPH